MLIRLPISEDTVQYLSCENRKVNGKPYKTGIGINEQAKESPRHYNLMLFSRKIYF